MSAASSRTSRCSTNPQRTDGTFSRADFAYDHERDLYICPAGKPLQRIVATSTMPRTGRRRKTTSVLYRASKRDCERLHAKPVLPEHAGPQGPALHPRSRPRHGPRHRQDRGLSYSRRQRKKVEMLFAHLKRILELDRLRLRGPNGARDEFLLAATAQNLRKLAKLIPAPAATSAAARCGTHYPPPFRPFPSLRQCHHDYFRPDFFNDIGAIPLKK